MTISDLIPTLQPTVQTISTQLRFICFFVLVAAMIVRTGTGNTDITHLLRPLTTNALVCAFLATLPFWFNSARDSFWAIAVQIQQDFTGSIADTGTKLMQQLQPPDGQVNWLDVTGSLWRALQWALAWIIVWLGAIIQGPMMFFQFIMACLCYMFLPIAVSLFAFDGTKGIATRYVQQTLAILAWPIGFATVDLVGNALLNSVATVVMGGGAVGVAAAAGEFGPASFLMAGFVAVWLILGSLATPIVMQALFCSGSPMSSVVGHAIQYGMGAAGLSRFVGSGGEPPAPTSDSKQSDGGGSSTSPVPLPPSGGGGSSASSGYTPTSPLPPTLGPVQRAALTSGTSAPALAGPPQPPALSAPASTAPAALVGNTTPSPSPTTAAALPPRGYTQPRSTPTVIDMVSDPSGTLYAASVMEQNQIPTAIAY